jgi:hypothetical protein
MGVPAMRALRDLADLAPEIERLHQAAAEATAHAYERLVACGRALMRAKERVGYGGWGKWVEANLCFGRTQADKYITAAERERELAELVHSGGQVTSLNKVVVMVAEPRANGHTLRVMGSSESSEWYTPPHIFELVEAALGEVDL